MTTTIFWCFASNCKKASLLLKIKDISSVTWMLFVTIYWILYMAVPVLMQSIKLSLVWVILAMLLLTRILKGMDLDSRGVVAVIIKSIYCFRFMDWLFNKYSAERKDDIKCVLMKSFGETLKLDMKAPKLKDHSVVIEVKAIFNHEEKYCRR